MKINTLFKLFLLLMFFSFYTCKKEKNIKVTSNKEMYLKMVDSSISFNKALDSFSQTVMYNHSNFDSIVQNPIANQNWETFKFSNENALEGMSFEELLIKFELYNGATIKYKWESDANVENPSLELNKIPIDLDSDEITDFKIPIDGSIHGYISCTGGFGNYSFEITEVIFSNDTKGTASIKPKIKFLVEEKQDYPFVINIENK